MATNDPRHEPVAAIETTTTSGARAAPPAQAACSQPMYRTPRFSEVWALAAASMRPEPPPNRRLTAGTIHHAGPRARPSKPAGAGGPPARQQDGRSEAGAKRSAARAGDEICRRKGGKQEAE